MKLLYNITEGIGRITLSNPPYNLLVDPAFEDPATLGAFLADPTLKAVLVKGAGRHFCAGADLSQLGDQLAAPEALRDALSRGKKLLEAISFATVPVIAAIRGSCLGAGLEIALSCHYRMASENALLGFPETNHGLIPGFLSASAAHEATYRQALLDLILSGRMIGAEEAQALGIVTGVKPTANLETAAVRYLDSLVKNRPPQLIRAVMESIHNGRKLPREEALRKETALFVKIAEENFNTKEASASQ